MHAAIFRDGQITVDTVPDPAPERGQVGQNSALRDLQHRPACCKAHEAVCRSRAPVRLALGSGPSRQSYDRPVAVRELVP
jgi:hypothetical protein